MGREGEGKEEKEDSEGESEGKGSSSRDEKSCAGTIFRRPFKPKSGNPPGRRPRACCVVCWTYCSKYSRKLRAVKAEQAGERAEAHRSKSRAALRH